MSLSVTEWGIFFTSVSGLNVSSSTVLRFCGGCLQTGYASAPPSGQMVLAKALFPMLLFPAAQLFVAGGEFTLQRLDIRPQVTY
ncbi:MAG TPA: hypothetical protein VNA27_09135 [Rubrobacteraceae bacterium]|nr:hypothetical protein [Rubrobacteraceae bacterium]